MKKKIKKMKAELKRLSKSHALLLQSLTSLSLSIQIHIENTFEIKHEWLPENWRENKKIIALLNEHFLKQQRLIGRLFSERTLKTAINVIYRYAGDDINKIMLFLSSEHVRQNNFSNLTTNLIEAIKNLYPECLSESESSVMMSASELLEHMSNNTNFPKELIAGKTSNSIAGVLENLNYIKYADRTNSQTPMYRFKFKIIES